MRTVFGLGVLWVASGCSLQGGNYAGKTCNSVTDCPFGYTCLLARPGGAATCEVLSPNLQILPPTGPVVSSDSYCTDVEPLLQQYCITCHVVPIPPEPPLIPVWFTLEAYGDDVDAGPQPDGGYILGAYTMAALSAQYVTNGLMPLSPSSVPVPLTAAQQKIFADWAAGGAPYCDGGSTSSPDAGGDSDAGDGG
jgi:hypothetical protein